MGVLGAKYEVIRREGGRQIIHPPRTQFLPLEPSLYNVQISRMGRSDQSRIRIGGTIWANVGPQMVERMRSAAREVSLLLGSMRIDLRNPRIDVAWARRQTRDQVFKADVLAILNSVGSLKDDHVQPPNELEARQALLEKAKIQTGVYFADLLDRSIKASDKYVIDPHSRIFQKPYPIW